MIKYLTNEADFDSEIQSGTVLVDFYADWCGPCQMLGPVLEELESQQDIKIIKINVDSLSGIARKFGVMSIPTLILFKDGKEVKKQTGYMPLQHLKAFIA